MSNEEVNEYYIGASLNTQNQPENIFDEQKYRKLAKQWIKENIGMKNFNSFDDKEKEDIILLLQAITHMKNGKKIEMKSERLLKSYMAMTANTLVIR